MSRLNPNPDPPAEGPTLDEMVKFRHRYGLEAYLLWCVAWVELPIWALLNLLRIGNHFGKLPEEKYDRTALQELIRVPIAPGLALLGRGCFESKGQKHDDQ